MYPNEQKIRLGGKDYPVRVVGNGSIDCLSIGTGTLIPNHLSKQFKDTFTVYATDLYWDSRYSLDNPEKLTISQITKDLKFAAHQLGLKSYVAMGHSCFGMVALEMAKEDPDINGVMLIASCPAWNDEFLAFTQEYFESHADEGRKANDAKRRSHYETVKKPTDSETSLTVYTRDSARYWANYEVDDKMIQSVWQDLVADDKIINRFFCELLPKYKVEVDLEKVTCPVLLIGGPYDFDSLPLVSWANHPAKEILGNNLTIVECPNSGHWPNIEDTEIFDKKTIAWAKNLFFK